MSETKIQIIAQGEGAVEVLNRVGAALQKAEAQTKASATSMAQQTKEAHGKMKSSWDQLVTGYNQGFELLGKAQAKLSSLYDFAKQGAEFAEAKATFQAYAASFAKNSDTIIEASRHASKGQVSDSELIKATMRAMQQGVSRDTNELAKLWEIAEVKSDQFGGTISENFIKISDAIAKGNGRALLELGLLPEAMGRASTASDLLEKRGSILKDVFSQFGEDVGRLSSAGDSTADSFNQLEATFENVKLEASEGLLPAFKDIAAFIKDDLIPITAGAFIRLRELRGIQDDVITRAYQNGVGGKKASIDEQLRPLREREADIIKRYNGMGGNHWNPMTGIRLLDELKPLQQQITALEKEKSTLFQQLKQDQSNEYARGQDEFFRQEAKDREKGIEALNKANKEAEKTHKEATKAAKDYSRELAQIDKHTKDVAEDAASAYAAAMGGKVIEPTKLAQNVMLAATKAAVGFAQALKDGATDAGKFEKLATTARDKSQEIGLASLGVRIDEKRGFYGFIGGKQERTWISEEEAEYKQKIADAKQAQESAQEEFRNKLRINVAGAFEEGLYDAMKSGSIEDFGKAIADSLRSQLASALSTAITGSVFGVGKNAGSFDLGSMLFSGGSGGGMTVGVNPLNFMTGGMSVSQGGAPASGGSSGLLGGLMKGVGPLMKGGALQFGNLTQLLGTGAIAGMAVNRLFGTGGLFSGSRVIHGQEQVQLSGDLNSQVGQAQKQRDELLTSLVGASASTLQALKDMQFYTTSVVGHKSGDGIFSKKTTTYEAVGVAEAQGSINKYLELSEKATAEAAAREFEIALKQLSNPLEALNMTINDLTAATARATDEQKQALDYQLKSAIAQKEQALNQYQAGWFATRMGTAAASAGSIFTPAMESAGGPVALRGGMWENMPNHLNQLNLLKGQGLRDFTLGKLGVNAGDSASANAEYLQARKDYLSDSLKTFENLMKDAEARARAAKENTDAAARAVQEFTAAQNAYYGAQLEQLQIEQQLQAAKKAKQEQIRDDVLGTMLTHVAEVSELGGKQVIVLAAGQPDARDLAVQIRDSLAGESPELAKALGDFIDSRGPRWN